MPRPAELHGILVIDKARGWTSHDVVARVRRLANQRQVGHGGTLDPLATGVLPLGLGQGTRLLEYVAHGDKTYEATVRFGAATDTYDAEGSVTRTAPWQHIDAATLRQTLGRFTGEILQRPPAFSAIKRAGQPLYTLARRGEAVEVEPRPVTIAAISMLRFAPPEVALRIDCGGGAYIRSLAHDLGEALGSAAHLTALRRTRTGGITLADSVSLDALSAGGADAIRDRLLALDRPVWPLPAVILGETHAADVCHGRNLRAADANSPFCRAYDLAGAFIALLRYDAQQRQWRPHKVFLTP